MTDYLDNAIDWLVTTLEDNTGESVTLSDGVGDFPLTGIVTPETIDRRQDETGLVIAYVREMTVTGDTTNSLNGGKPMVGMTATIGDQLYDVETVIDTGRSLTLGLVRYQIRERSKQNYRR